MNKQQKYLLEMLKEIHGICVKNDITYYIAMGTLIGAARNCGFLPWDDDADVIMTYENWEKFQVACQTDLPDNRHLGAPKLQDYYGHMMPRYMAKDTTCIHTCQSLHDEVSGEIIDIFVLDPISDKPGEYESYIQDMWMYSAVVNYANITGARFNLDPEVFREMKQLEKEQGRAAVVQKLEANLVRHFSDDGHRYAFRWQGVPICFERSWFEETIMIPFEDTELMAPAGVNEFLTCYYGEEWVNIPGKINPSKHNTAYSLDFPYTEALEYFKPTYDRAELRELTEVRRNEVIDYSPENNALRDIEAQVKADVVRLETLKVLESHGDELKAALSRNDGKATRTILDRYITTQISPDIIGRHFPTTYFRYARPILIDVGDDAFEATLLTLLSENNIRYVARLLEIRKLKGMAITEQMAAYVQVVELFNNAANNYHRGKYDECLVYVDKLLELDICSQNAEVLYLACASLMKRYLEQKTQENENAALEKLRFARELYPADGVFAKLEADHLDSKGESGKARELYLRAAESTHNGLSIRDIAEKTGYYPRMLRNPDWAIEAGVPRWNEAEPEPLDAGAVKGGPNARPADYGWKKPHDLLMDMLSEVTERLEGAGAPYVLAPDAAFALSRKSLKPDSAETFAVVAKAHDVLRLVESMEGNAPANRTVRYMGNDAAAHWTDVLYCATDSTYGSLKNGVNQNDYLAIRIIPIHYPRDQKAFEELKGKWVEDADSKTGKQLFQSVSKKRLLHGNGVIDLGEGTVPFDETLIRLRKTVQIDGHSFKVPVDMKRYAGLATKKKVKPELVIPPAMVCSAMLSPAEILDAGVIPPNLPERYRANAKRKKKSFAILKKFKQNYAELKFAVSIKEVANSLLPRKEEIMASFKRGEIDKLKPLFEEYIRLSKQSVGKNMVEFDPDLYQVMCRLK